MTTTLSADDLDRVLGVLRAASPDASPEGLWDAFAPEDLPKLFRVLDASAELYRLRTLTDRPATPTQAREAPSFSVAADAEAARKELEEAHCVNVEGLLAERNRRALDAEIERQQEARLGFWGQLSAEEAPELHRIFEAATGSDAFRKLTGFDPQRDEFSLTLSLQDLQADGIAWHRDLYWPKEWVGQDVFAVLYGLGDDTPELGGAFLYYVPWRGGHGETYAVYRRRHQATILWNSADPEGRILHAVSRYHTDTTARHLIILQCLRRSP